METGIIVALLLIMLFMYLNSKNTFEENKELKESNDRYKFDYKMLQTNYNTEVLDKRQLKEQLNEEQEKNRVILSQKKSSETRVGLISENLLPFLDQFPHDPKNLTFIGRPIDYLCVNFDDGTITFIEVKSGGSKISKRQKTIKHIIESGRVYYEEYRLDEKGVNRKTFNNKDENGKG